MSSAEIVRRDPARPDQVVGRVPTSTPREVAEAVAAAHAAGAGWRSTTVEARARALRSALEAVEAQAGPLALLLARELGKPLADSEGEVVFAVALARWAATEAPALLAVRETDDERGRLILERRPWGVVAAITPWNAPVVLAMLKVAPALVSGNTVVVKPSPLAPLAVAAVLTAMAGRLPPGTLQVVQGGAEAGSALAGDPRVARIAFTGGPQTARALGGIAARMLTPMLLELGGNDPAVLLEDVHLDEAVAERLLVGAFATAGQVCMAIKRLYVHRSRCHELIELLTDVAGRVLVVGDPLDRDVTVGPLVTEEAAARVRGLVRDSAASGARLIPVGRVDEDAVARGWFARPTLVLGLDDTAPLVAGEQFGPALPLQVYDSEDEVVARANAGEVGLGASAWSADEERAVRMARRLEAGFRFVNTHNRAGLALRAPFGGIKRSGYGREYGAEGILEYTQTCPIHVPASVRAGAQAPAAASYPAT